MVRVTFSIHDYTDTVECDVVPMTICHLLLGRPWQFDRRAAHDGYANTYAFRWHGKGVKLLPMSPTQIIAANMQKKMSGSERKKKDTSAVHKSLSESHNPNMSGKRENERKSMVVVAKKSEMREMRENPNITHFVLLYKDAILTANDMTSLPSAVSNVLQAFDDVFPKEVPAGLPPLRGIEHQIDLIPGASLPNRTPYRTSPEETKDMYVKVLVLVLSLLFLFQRKTVLGECVLIVELLTISLSVIVIQFLGLMTCLTNLVVLLFSLKLTYVVDTIRLE
jgi:hypothetical protein